MSLFSRIFCLSALFTAALAAGVSRKVGLAWGGDEDQVTQFEQTGKVSWYYHWAAQPAFTQTDLEFVPMLWGQKDVADWASSINSTVSNLDVKAVLGMNEPDLGAQSALTPTEGAAMWETYIQPLKERGVLLVSPAPTSAPTGPEWIGNFTAICGAACTVDRIALHYYGTNATAMIQYLNDVHTMFNKSIWVTEFACQDFVDSSNVCSLDDVMAFMNTTVTFMESSDFIERYSWFGAFTDISISPANALMDSNGQINALGLQYIGAVTDNTSGGGVPGTAQRRARIYNWPAICLWLLLIVIGLANSQPVLHIDKNTQSVMIPFRN